MSQTSLINRLLAMASKALGGGTKTTPIGTTTPLTSGQQIVQQIKAGGGAISTGQSGRVLVSGAKVGTGVAIGGAGVGYGLTELSKPVTAFTDPIDSLVGFSGVGSIIIIGIIILVLIIILRGKI